MKKRFFVLTAFGKDRPGLVAGVTEAIYSLKGNIEDASMTRLGGEFTIMLVCAMPGGQPASALGRALRRWEKKLGLTIAVRPINALLARHSRRSPARWMLSVYGTDRPGIVHDVAQALAQRQCSITDLNTRVLDKKPRPVYVMLLEVSAPARVDVDALRDDLDRLRQSLGVDITLQDIDPVEL